MLKEVQLPQNGTMMPAVTKTFAISSSMRHEEGSCCEEGYSGLQKVTSPALTCVFLTISAKTHSLRFAYRFALSASRCAAGPTETIRTHFRLAMSMCGMQEMLGSSFFWVQHNASVMILRHQYAAPQTVQGLIPASIWP